MLLLPQPSRDASFDDRYSVITPTLPLLVPLSGQSDLHELHDIFTECLEPSEELEQARIVNHITSAKRHNYSSSSHTRSPSNQSPRNHRRPALTVFPQDHHRQHRVHNRQPKGDPHPSLGINPRQAQTARQQTPRNPRTSPQQHRTGQTHQEADKVGM